MPSFEYEPLVLSLELESSDEKKNRGDIDGARPLGIRVEKKARNFRGGKNNPKKEAVE